MERINQVTEHNSIFLWRHMFLDCQPFSVLEPTLCLVIALYSYVPCAILCDLGNFERYLLLMLYDVLFQRSG